MSDAETASDPPSDPLGKRRCPKCLYDRYGLADGQACPECGYTLRAGACVLNLPRAQSVAAPFVLGIYALMCAFTIVDGDLRGGFERAAMVTSAGVAIFFIVSRRARLNDRVATTCQVWLTADGVGLRPDADQTSFLRLIDRPIPQSIVFLPILLLWNTHAYLLAGLFVAGLVAATIVVATAHRRYQNQYSMPLDNFAPPLLCWPHVRSLRLRRRNHRFDLTVQACGFWSWPVTISFIENIEIARSVSAVVTAFREPMDLTATR